MELKGKLAIITGGNRGIGRGIAEALAQEGANLAIVYRKNVEAFEDLKSSLEPSGIQLKGHQINIVNFDDVKKAFKDIYNHFGSIDILVNCAGRASGTSSVAKSTLKEWHAVFDVDLHAVFYCSKAVLEYMRSGAGGGTIINISSIVASTCQAGSAPYAAAKAGLEAFTKVLAREEAIHGIRVNAIAPGLIESDMSDRMSKVYGDEKMKEIYESIPLGSFGTPRDIGNLVAYLVSPKGNYITGQVLGVDGGMYYWKSSFVDI
jgi:3-oxoacyl-[acyl-carrier protein] reductase